MELLGNVGHGESQKLLGNMELHIESLFFPFGDSVSVGAR
jgi:hypothetical protein